MSSLAAALAADGDPIVGRMAANEALNALRLKRNQVALAHYLADKPLYRSLTRGETVFALLLIRLFECPYNEAEGRFDYTKAKFAPEDMHGCWRQFSIPRAAGLMRMTEACTQRLLAMLVEVRILERKMEHYRDEDGKYGSNTFYRLGVQSLWDNLKAAISWKLEQVKVRMTVRRAVKKAPSSTTGNSTEKGAGNPTEPVATEAAAGAEILSPVKCCKNAGIGSITVPPLLPGVEVLEGSVDLHSTSEPLKQVSAGAESTDSEFPEVSKTPGTREVEFRKIKKASATSTPDNPGLQEVKIFRTLPDNQLTSSPFPEIVEDVPGKPTMVAEVSPQVAQVFELLKEMYPAEFPDLEDVHLVTRLMFQSGHDSRRITIGRMFLLCQMFYGTWPIPGSEGVDYHVFPRLPGDTLPPRSLRDAGLKYFLRQWPKVWGYVQHARRQSRGEEALIDLRILAQPEQDLERGLRQVRESWAGFQAAFPVKTCPESALLRLYLEERLAHGCTSPYPLAVWLAEQEARLSTVCLRGRKLLARALRATLPECVSLVRHLVQQGYDVFTWMRADGYLGLVQTPFGRLCQELDRMILAVRSELAGCALTRAREHLQVGLREFDADSPALRIWEDLVGAADAIRFRSSTRKPAEAKDGNPVPG